MPNSYNKASATQQFIEKAIEGGWDSQGLKNAELVMANFYHQPTYLLDPKFWEAVGKVEGWGEILTGETEETATSSKFKRVPEWQFNMNGLTPAIISESSIEEYLKTLL